MTKNSSTAICLSISKFSRQYVMRMARNQARQKSMECFMWNDDDEKVEEI